MQQLLDDILYKSKNAYAEVSYRAKDLWRDPRGRVRLIAGAVMGVTLLVLVIVQAARWLAPAPPPPGGIVEARLQRVDADAWIARARAALEGNDAFAGVSITETGRGDKKGVRVRGRVPDMAARAQCLRLLGDLGVPANLDMEITVDPASLEPGP
jgi:hypothetical protein